jgi:hypothetical protein
MELRELWPGLHSRVFPTRRVCAGTRRTREHQQPMWPDWKCMEIFTHTFTESPRHNMVCFLVLDGKLVEDRSHCTVQMFMLRLNRPVVQAGRHHLLGFQATWRKTKPSFDGLYEGNGRRAISFCVCVVIHRGGRDVTRGNFSTASSVWMWGTQSGNFPLHHPLLLPPSCRFHVPPSRLLKPDQCSFGR